MDVHERGEHDAVQPNRTNQLGTPAVAAALPPLSASAASSHPTAAAAADKSLELLNVSYDPTRELWRDLNDAFIPQYAKETGVDA